MKKIKRHLLSLILVLAYAVGTLFSPISANNNASFIDELLGERENAHKNTAQSTENAVKRKVKISDFADVKENDWFYPYLEYLVEKGMINGKTETTFEPNSTFSYAECSAVIVRYLGLEKEAARRQKEIVSKFPEMKNQWYVGYFDVLSSLGLFADYGLFETDGKSIVSVDKAAANSPVVRYRFAESISQSFELDSVLKAKNVFSEMGGSGREFISGGAYKKDALEMYKTYIADFEQIPEPSRENVLKAYYNGIFNGDTSGNFYPNNNLTRAEMAKVLATVSDYSLRVRLIDDKYALPVDESMLHTDAFGEKTVSFETWKELLAGEAKNVDIINGYVRYVSGTNAPDGYAIDVYLYTKNGNQYEKSTECSLRNGKTGFTYYTANARVLVVLRNVKEGARPEGVVQVTVSSGAVTDVKPLVREM